MCLCMCVFVRVCVCTLVRVCMWALLSEKKMTLWSLRVHGENPDMGKTRSSSSQTSQIAHRHTTMQWLTVCMTCLVGACRGLWAPTSQSPRCAEWWTRTPVAQPCSATLTSTAWSSSPTRRSARTSATGAWWMTWGRWTGRAMLLKEVSEGTGKIGCVGGGRGGMVDDMRKVDWQSDAAEGGEWRNWQDWVCGWVCVWGGGGWWTTWGRWTGRVVLIRPAGWLISQLTLSIWGSSQYPPPVDMPCWGWSHRHWTGSWPVKDDYCYWFCPSGRQWTYQTCTEFGYYQTSDSKGQPFGFKFPLEFFIKQCQDIYNPKFNADLISRGINRTNTNYGGYGIKVTNVVFPNGSVDPWHALGIVKDLSPDATAIFIDGEWMADFPVRDFSVSRLIPSIEEQQGLFLRREIWPKCVKILSTHAHTHTHSLSVSPIIIHKFSIVLFPNERAQRACSHVYIIYTIYIY